MTWLTDFYGDKTRELLVIQDSNEKSIGQIVMSELSTDGVLV